jgi:hypothetical protein
MIEDCASSSQKGRLPPASALNLKRATGQPRHHLAGARKVMDAWTKATHLLGPAIIFVLP